MTRRETMDELRQTQGDGRMRNRRRQMAQSFTAMGAIVQTPRASLVVAGPQGPAVAVKARAAQPPSAVSPPGSTPGGGRATGVSRPRVIARGEGPLAQRMLQAARRAGVPVTIDGPLARELFQATEAGGSVSAATNERLMKIVHELHESHEEESFA